MSKLLTISIAAYNVEKTIEKCLDSFIPCHYLDDMEILVINDGSYDNTENIVEQYVKKYPNSIKLINKENGGHGSTLNKSLEISNGKFYKVIDGDDWVNPTELDLLMECLNRTDAELIINDYMEVYPDHKSRISHRNQFDENRVYSFDDIFQNDNSKKSIFAMHETTILTQRLRDVNMCIQEHCFYADTEFQYYVGLAARTIEFHNSCAYQYRLGVAGQSVSPEGTYKHIEDFLKVEYHLMRLFQQDKSRIQSKTRKNYLFFIIDTRYHMLFDCYISIIHKSDKDKFFIRFLKNVKKDFPDIVACCNLPILYRITSVYPTVIIPWMRIFKRSKFFHMLNKIKQNL